MNPSTGIVSYSLFGIRVDTASPTHATLAIWESALARSGLRVVLADLWTFLFAQRDYTVWESLSSADYVIPAGNPGILRRLMHNPDVPIVQVELLLADLFEAAARDNKVVAVLAPEAELSADLALARQIWPSLQAVGLSRNTLSTDFSDPALVRAVNTLRPDILVAGGDSPWQERWMHEHRGRLAIGVAVLLPTLHTALAACAQRAGLQVANLRRLRRQAAVQRALGMTIGPMATASAATLGSWLHGARGGLSGWSETMETHRAPAALKGLSLPALPDGKHVTVRVAELRDPDEIAAARRLGASPLARLAPPSTPLAPTPEAPAAEERRAIFAEQPTVALPLDSLRGAPPPIATGYIVETIEPTPAEDEAPAGSGALPEPGSSEESDHAPAAPLTPGQLAPTTRLAARFAEAAAAAAASSAVDEQTQSDTGETEAAPLVELPPTQRLPQRVPYVPIPDDLPATTLLGAPEETPLEPVEPVELAEASVESRDGDMPQAAADASPAFVVAEVQAQTPAPPHAVPRVPRQAAGRPSRTRRLYKARRPRRTLARKRRRSRSKPTRPSPRA